MHSGAILDTALHSQGHKQDGEGVHFQAILLFI